MNRLAGKKNFVSLRKSSGETFLFFYNDATRYDVLRTFARFAAQDDLDFSWTDAAKLAHAVRTKGTHAL